MKTYFTRVYIRRVDMNGEGTPAIVPMTEEIFFKHLRKGPIQNHFAENAGALMNQMQSMCPPSENRARTYGFVIPSLSNEERQAILALLPPLRVVAEINALAKVDAGNNTIASYVHITLRNVPPKKGRTYQ